MRKRNLAVGPAIGLIALAVTGCTAKGGGFIDSATGADKATFGFAWETTRNDDVLRGSWRDGPVRFRLDGGVQMGGSSQCLSGTGGYVSTWKPNSGGGTLQIGICDYGEPGPTSGDTISVQVQSGPYSGYSNSGTLQGGNLQVKEK